MPDRIGVGVIGTGFMGRCHALAWRNVRSLFGDVAAPELAVVCDADPDAARAAAADFGFARAVTDWRALVAAPEVQIVSVTLPNALHREAAIATLRAGKHVWCEKPMGLTLADAEAMADAADAAPHLVTALGYNYLRNPAVDHAARLVAEGAIGTVVHVRGTMDEDYAADPDLPWSWRCRRAEAGLGVLGDLMCHAVSMVHRLAGPIARVCGDMDTVHRTRPVQGDPATRREVENDDIATALVRFASGATGTLTASRVACGRKNRLAWEVHGTRGMLTFDQERMNELRLFHAEGPAATRGVRTILTGPAHPPYAAFCPAPGHQLGFNDLKAIEAALLLRAIAGQGPAPTPFREGLAIERVIHGIAESAGTGRWVDLPQAAPQPGHRGARPPAPQSPKAESGTGLAPQ